MIDSKLTTVGTSIFTVMSALANEHKAINLAQGFPDFKIDQRLKDLVVESLVNEQVQYAPMRGRQDLLEAISAKLHKQHGIHVDPVDEITITSGATQAIYTVISTVVNAGDEVIMFDPSYDCYAPTVLVNKGVPVHLNLSHPDYRINWAEVRENITSRTRLIIVNNPHNPCCSVWDESDIKALEALVKDFPQIIILSDEVYEHIQFNGTHQSVLKSPTLRARSFVTYSFGKTLHATGWKLGYCVAPKSYSEEFRKVHQFLVFSANNSMQYAIAKYLQDPAIWEGVTAMYQKKRDLFLKAMEGSRFKALPSNGTYFCLLDYSDISDKSDIDFAKEMTIEYGVAVLPISVFYKDGTDRKVVRICFAKEEDTLLRAAELLSKV